MSTGVRCLVLGHSWRLLSENFVHANRLDLGSRRTWYCVRCLAERTTKA